MMKRNLLLFLLLVVSLGLSFASAPPMAHHDLDTGEIDPNVVASLFDYLANVEGESVAVFESAYENGELTITANSDTEYEIDYPNYSFQSVGGGGFVVIDIIDDL